ncbi:hypothetical protein LXA43DRAFT_975340 [Ganoderma leucocontextum]|nr:hypothetical protein LXA43DRAFT_975340 [Ganoderma leucocontextum]
MDVVVPSAPLPPTSNAVDADVLRTQRRSDRKLAKLLGITVAREDGPPSAVEVDRDDADPLHRFGEPDREDESHSERWHVPAAWSYASASATGGDDEGRPLIDDALDDEVDVRGKGKIRQRLSGFNPFRRRKADKSGPPTLFGRVMRPSLAGESATGAQNPFGDEHAIEGNGRGGGLAEEERMETHDGPFPTPSAPSGQWVTFPSLAAQTVSAPTTPKRSPRSMKSRRTPGSAKSWLSAVSNTSELSTVSSLRRKNLRRRARLSGGHESQMRSMRKTVQVLGPEAAGAVVKETGVSPNKLRCMDFGRQMRAYVKRHM